MIRLRSLRSRSLALVAVVALSACGSPPDILDATPTPTPRDPLREGPSSTPFVPPPSPAATDPIADERPPIPSGFPVMDEAEPALLDPAQPSMIAHWFVPLGSYDVFAFYSDELPRAGFPIEGLYPGEGVGIIRFHAGSQILQVLLTGDLEQTDLILRTDLP